MYIYEIMQPGNRLKSPNPDIAYELEGILQGLKEEFYEANLALNMFLVQQDKDISIFYQDYDIMSSRMSEITTEIESKHNTDRSFETRKQISFDAEVSYEREMWKQGCLPKEFERRLIFTYAKNFLHAVDAFGKSLKVLSENTYVPQNISRIYSEFVNAFPDVTGLRNTAQHMEDRRRGLKGMGENKKPISLQPLHNELLEAPTGALVLNCLNGSKYMSTMADGSCGEVDVSPHSMDLLQNIFQKTIDSFSWTGFKQHFPA